LPADAKSRVKAASFEELEGIAERLLTAPDLGQALGQIQAPAPAARKQPAAAVRRRSKRSSGRRSGKKSLRR